MSVEHSIEPLDRALARSSCGQEHVLQKPRLLSHNVPSLLAGDLADYLPGTLRTCVLVAVMDMHRAVGRKLRGGQIEESSDRVSEYIQLRTVALRKNGFATVG